MNRTTSTIKSRNSNIITQHKWHHLTVIPTYHRFDFSQSHRIINTDIRQSLNKYSPFKDPLLKSTRSIRSLKTAPEFKMYNLYQRQGVSQGIQKT